jgi:hypothetical protein
MDRKSADLNSVDRWCLHRLLSRQPTGLGYAFAQKRVAQRPRLKIHYDLLRQTQRVAAGSPALGEEQMSALAQRIVNDTLVVPTAQNKLHALRWPAFASLAVASAVVLVLVLPDSGSEPGTADLQARSALRDDNTRVGVTARCMEVSKGGTAVVAEAHLTPIESNGGLRCSSTGIVGFSVTNLADAPWHVFVVGVTRENELRWYAPFDEHTGSVVVLPQTVDRVLAPLADLTPMPDAEEIALFALFAPSSLDIRDISRALRDLSAANTPLFAMDRLPLPIATQARTELVVSPRVQTP